MEETFQPIQVGVLPPHRDRLESLLHRAHFTSKAFSLTTLDWIIIAFLFLMALWGYLQGLVVSAFSLGGFAIGALVGARLAPVFLAGGSSSPYAPLFTLIGGLMLGSLAAV